MRTPGGSGALIRSNPPPTGPWARADSPVVSTAATGARDRRYAAAHPIGSGPQRRERDASRLPKTTLKGSKKAFLRCTRAGDADAQARQPDTRRRLDASRPDRHRGDLAKGHARASRRDRTCAPKMESALAISAEVIPPKRRISATTAGPRISAAHELERLVERDQLVESAFRGLGGLQRFAPPGSPTPLSGLGARMVDQDLPHRAGRRSHEVTVVAPVPPSPAVSLIQAS